MTFKTVLSVALLTTSLAFAAPVASAAAGTNAHAHDARISATLNLSGFDVSTRQGVAEAHTRIVSTANSVCSSSLHGVSASRIDYRSCVTDAVNETVDQLHNPNLTSFHNALSQRDRISLNKTVPQSWSPVS